MKIECYCLEFYFFDGCEWNDMKVEIKALNMFQLMRSFLRETECIYNQNQKQLWNEIKSSITKEIITFPIININFY